MSCEPPFKGEAGLLGHKVPSRHVMNRKITPYTKEDQLKVYMSKKEYNKQTIFKKLKDKYDYRRKDARG